MSKDVVMVTPATVNLEPAGIPPDWILSGVPQYGLYFSPDMSLLCGRRPSREKAGKNNGARHREDAPTAHYRASGAFSLWTLTCYLRRH
jgi:hypothetical protein